jgi:hypothetical protein
LGIYKSNYWVDKSAPALAQVSFDRTRLLSYNESSLSLEQQENVKEAEPQVTNETFLGLG